MRSIQLTALLLTVSTFALTAGLSPPAANETTTSSSQPTDAPVPTTKQSTRLALDSYFEGFDGCFVLLNLESGTTSRYNPARCAERFSPCSTFKIPNAIIGLETGVITDADHPMKWDGTDHRRKECNRDQTLRTAIRDSVVWYFQRLAAGVGGKRMQHWLDRFDYGSRDMSGGLTTFWLDNSLKISADEQVAFLAKFQRGELPISERTREFMKELLRYKNEPGFVLRGKTGSQADSSYEHAILGWYVGTLEKDNMSFVFACNISSKTSASGRKAREITEKLLGDLVIKCAPRGATDHDE